jgi:hypothetical protein
MDKNPKAMDKKPRPEPGQVYGEENALFDKGSIQRESLSKLKFVT